MTEDMQSLRDDIAYLKALAEGGRDGSGAGGWILIGAGGLYGLASLVQWAALERLVPPMASSVAWLGALVLFFIVLFATKARQKAGPRSPAASLGWQGIGWSLFIIFAAIAVATWRTNSVLLISFSPSIVMALYGGAWSIAAVVTGKPWLWGTTFGSFLAALISAWMIGANAQWLVYAASLFLLAFVPGVAFVMNGRKQAT